MKHMQQLRSKVYKKVKPKKLNNKNITGLMYLELCRSYVESINKGSVPNIESAWTSLCKNENLRTVKVTIDAFGRELAAKT